MSPPHVEGRLEVPAAFSSDLFTVKKQLIPRGLEEPGPPTVQDQGRQHKVGSSSVVSSAVTGGPASGFLAGAPGPSRTSLRPGCAWRGPWASQPDILR